MDLGQCKIVNMIPTAMPLYSMLFTAGEPPYTYIFVLWSSCIRVVKVAQVDAQFPFPTMAILVKSYGRLCG